MGQVYCQLESSVVGLAKAGGGVGHRGACEGAEVGKGAMGTGREKCKASESSEFVCVVQKPRGQTVMQNIVKVGQSHSSFQGPSYVTPPLFFKID